MNDYVKAWQCIGCGRVEAPQTCVGICHDRKVEFVYRFEHEEMLAQLEIARQQVRALNALVQRLAWTKPREDEWEHSYRALQEQARRTLAAVAGNPGVLPAPNDAKTATQASEPRSSTSYPEAN